MDLQDFIKLTKITKINDNIYETVYNTYVSKEKYHFQNDNVEFDYRIICEFKDHQSNHIETNYWVTMVVDYDSIHQTFKENYKNGENYNIENGDYYNCRIFHIADFILKQKTKIYYMEKEQKDFLNNKENIIKETLNKMLKKIPQIEPKIKNKGATKYQTIKYVIFNN